jgi:diguanylate cyclase (GGDEF)-like protein/PAS domain S-box-containing protein
MIRPSTTVRLSFGLVLLTISILFAADMIGLIPNRSKAIIFERERICESLAVYYSVAAQKDDISTILDAVQILVKKNDDILSAAVRREDGKIMVASKDHDKYWKEASEDHSTPTHVRVPIYKGDIAWGNIEVSFLPIQRKGILWLWDNTLVKLFGFIILIGFVLYKFFLSRTLRHLDPSSVVPPRVKSALDSLMEGVVLTDHNERIVLANTAFAEKVGTSTSSLLGRKPSDMKWIIPKSDVGMKDFPWLKAINEKQNQTGVRLELPDQRGNRKLVFMVNSTPILDGYGKCRGSLATFNDVTQIEEKNEQLRVMLEKLEISRSEIQRKNKELEFLATHDPLTNCLNRRAFFERLKSDFSSARRYSHEISCIMLDIDYFKSVNDTYGHSAGDEVLKGISKTLKSTKRDSDTVGRYGGEEFCVILPHTDINGAIETAERFRMAIESSDFSGIQVTSSFGVSSISFGAADESEIVDQADKALYIAKEKGRNRVISWEQKEVGDNMKSSGVTVRCDTVVTNANKETEVAGASAMADGIKTVNDNVIGKEITSYAVLENSHYIDRSKNARELVRDVIDDSAKISKSLGLHVSLNKTGDAAVQLNQDGGWGEGGEIDKKNQLHVSAISQAVNVLKESSKD